jgi:uncharacterized membrane protein
MSGGVSFALTLVAALGSGLIGGVFFAFSAFMMKALARLRPDQGIAAMQSINVTVLNRWFLAPFFGTAAACILLALSSLSTWREPAILFRLIGSGLYLAGTMLVTIVCNVPRNDALARVRAESEEGEDYWTHYVPIWTRWNTVRSVASIAASAALTVALVVGRTRDLG